MNSKMRLIHQIMILLLIVSKDTIHSKRIRNGPTSLNVKRNVGKTKLHNRGDGQEMERRLDTVPTGGPTQDYGNFQ